MSIQKQTKKVVLALVFLGCCCAGLSEVKAEKLPSMEEMPWAGFLSGYVRHGFEFGLNDEGVGEIYLKSKARKRIGVLRKVKVLTEVLVVDSKGKTTVKHLKKDEGFETEQEPGLKHKEIHYIAESQGDVRVAISIQYKENKLVMDGEILDRGKLKKADLYVSLKVVVPAMYTRTYVGEYKKSKARMKKDLIKFTRAEDRKTIKLKSYEPVNLSEENMAKGGVTRLMVSMDGQEGRDFIFTTTDEKGVLQFENKKPNGKGSLWEGYTVKWKRKLNDKSSSALVIEVK